MQPVSSGGFQHDVLVDGLDGVHINDAQGDALGSQRFGSLVGALHHHARWQ